MQLRDMLKTLDFDMEVDGDALITDLIVIAKVQRLDGRTTILQARTEGTDAITSAGLISIAYVQSTNDWKEHGDNE